jgi:hypothetical protein
LGNDLGDKSVEDLGLVQFVESDGRLGILGELINDSLNSNLSGGLTGGSGSGDLVSGNENVDEFFSLLQFTESKSANGILSQFVDDVVDTSVSNGTSTLGKDSGDSADFNVQVNEVLGLVDFTESKSANNFFSKLSHNLFNGSVDLESSFKAKNRDGGGDGNVLVGGGVGGISGRVGRVGGVSNDGDSINSLNNSVSVGVNFNEGGDEVLGLFYFTESEGTEGFFGQFGDDGDHSSVEFLVLSEEGASQEFLDHGELLLSLSMFAESEGADDLLGKEGDLRGDGVLLSEASEDEAEND